MHLLAISHVAWSDSDWNDSVNIVSLAGGQGAFKNFECLCVNFQTMHLAAVCLMQSHVMVQAIAWQTHLPMACPASQSECLHAHICPTLIWDVLYVSENHLDWYVSENHLDWLLCQGQN